MNQLCPCMYSLVGRVHPLDHIPSSFPTSDGYGEIKKKGSASIARIAQWTEIEKQFVLSDHFP